MRPPELRIEGCVIQTSYGTKGKVVRVEGPYPPDPGWYARPRLGGYTIVYEPLDGGGPCWINDAFVEDGRIFAHPWRDEITVVGVAETTQLSLF